MPEVRVDIQWLLIYGHVNRSYLFTPVSSHAGSAKEVPPYDLLLITHQ